MDSPVETITIEDLRLVYLGIGVHFGRPVSHNSMSDLVGDVLNVGNQDRNERAYRSSRELPPHTDRADHITMLCIQPAMNGGQIGYASGMTVHNIMCSKSGRTCYYTFIMDFISIGLANNCPVNPE